MQIIDLSQTIKPNMPLFSTKAPQPRIQPWMSHLQSGSSGIYEDCSCEISQIAFVTSIGTYLDSPFHYDPGGKSIEAVELQQTILPAITIDCTRILSQEPIEPSLLDGVDIEGKAVLFHTGWSRYWGQIAYNDFPFLSRDTAQTLLDGGAKLVGIDTLVIDDTNDPKRPVHNTLLKNDILIVENLTNLDLLPTQGFIFHAAPAKIYGVAAFPVRAYAVIQ